MELLDKDAASHIIGFLDQQSSVALSQTSRTFRNFIESNRCEVITQGYWDPKHPEYGGWEDLRRFPTKEVAVQHAEEQKQDSCVHFAEIGWVASQPEWTIEWNRE